MSQILTKGRATLHHLKGLRSQTGAFDLPSIITGVVVVGILAAGVLAAVFGVIPFAQDNAAKQDLDAVRTAQGVAKSRLDGFKDKPGLLSNRLIDDAPTLGVAADDAGTCYVGLSKSGTGKVFIATNSNTQPVQLTGPAPETGCVDAAELEPILEDIGGPGDSSTPDGSTPDGSAPDGSSPTTVLSPTTTDLDGDRVMNAFDPSPRGETNQFLAGFGGNYSSELGTTVDTTTTTGYIIQGPLAGQRIGLLSENTGSSHACATLESTGALYCWGYNDYGQVGNGARGGNVSEPVKVVGLDGKVISQVVTNGYNTCAIADGAPYCWGSYSLISDDYVLTPTAVDPAGVLAGKTITKLVGGNQFACVLADGAPYCWGLNSQGQLGNGTFGSENKSYTPTPVNTSGALADKTITDLGATNNGPCAIASGAAYCWGRGDSATIGNGTRLTENPLPVAVTGLEGKTVTTIAGGYSNTCAVADGAAYCWGRHTGDYSNMLGDGVKHPYNFSDSSLNYQTTPKAVVSSGALAGKTVTHVDMGGSHVCVIAGDAPYCWGEWESNDPGSEYGYVETFVPVAVGGDLAASNKTVGLWTTDGSTIFSYITS